MLLQVLQRALALKSTTWATSLEQDEATLVANFSSQISTAVSAASEEDLKQLPKGIQMYTNPACATSSQDFKQKASCSIHA